MQSSVLVQVEEGRVTGAAGDIADVHTSEAVVRIDTDPGVVVVALSYSEALEARLG